MAEPPQGGPCRFVHNDICPDHLLIDPAVRRLAGLIDFADAMAGEVVLDFVGLIGVAGYGLIRRAAGSYELPLGKGFDTKLGWLARTLTLTWLAGVARDDAVNVPALPIARSYAPSGARCHRAIAARCGRRGHDARAQRAGGLGRSPVGRLAG